MPEYDYDCDACGEESISVSCRMADRRDQQCPFCGEPLGRNNISAAFIATPGISKTEVLGTRPDGSQLISLNGPPPAGVDFEMPGMG